MSLSDGNYTRRLQRSFVVVALLFGTTLGLAMPPMQVADEPAHFYSAQLVSQMDLVPGTVHGRPGGFVPRWARQLGTRFTKVLFNVPSWKPRPDQIASMLARSSVSRTRPVFVEFHRVYSPVVHLPQAVALRAADAAGWPAWARFYAGRFAGLLVWIASVSIAIRWTPVLKEVLWILALTPMALSTAASYSADTVTTGIAWLYVAGALRVALDPEVMLTKAWVATLALLAALLANAKYAYLPLIALALAIPRAAASSRRAWCVAMIAISATACASLVVWAWTAGAAQIAAPVRYDLPPGSRPWHQLVDDPVSLARSILTTTWQNARVYRGSMIGWLGENLGTRVPPWVTAAYWYGAILLALGGADSRYPLAPRQRVLAVSLALAIYAGILAVARLRWSLDPSVIEGVQGRYLLPIAPAAALGLVCSKLVIPERARRVGHIVVVSLVVIALSASVGAVARRYYDVDGSFAAWRVSSIAPSRGVR